MEETEMTTRQDHEFSNFANIPICIQPGKGLQTRGVGWEQQPASAPSSPSLPFLPWLSHSCFASPPKSRGGEHAPWQKQGGWQSRAPAERADTALGKAFLQ